MDFMSIIIDRVESTSVFNIVQDKLPTQNTHLQRKIDNDLIDEFLSELEKLYRISNTTAETENSLFKIDVTNELRKIGEIFFLQFFPEEIQELLRQSSGCYLFLHTDHQLRHIPIELCHDGQSFLLDKFFIGKNISGAWRHPDFTERERLRVLIIADPTEELEWARLEGEMLYESLNAELSADRLDVKLLSGRNITKLNLLNAIKDKEIIHYAGHLYYHPNPEECGWLLADNKVLRAREIEKAGLSPFLVFSNSCLSSSLREQEQKLRSSAPIYNEQLFTDLAGSFLRAGIGNYIGTNWEIRDSKHTHNFAMQFYRAIFNDNSVGEALYEARQHFRQMVTGSDLTWANYVLHGNPHTKLYRTAHRRTLDASRNQFGHSRILETYPLPIAAGYAEFMNRLNTTDDPVQCMTELIETFKHTILTVGAIIFGNYRYLNFKGELPDTDAPQNLAEWLETIFICINSIRSLKMELISTGLMECLFLHRDPLYKLLDWTIKFDNKLLEDEDLATHQVTYQYLFDNFLYDLSPIGRQQLLYINHNAYEATLLRGQSVAATRILPAEFNEITLQKKLKRLGGQLCIYNNKTRVIFSLEEFMQWNPNQETFSWPAFNELRQLLKDESSAKSS